MSVETRRIGLLLSGGAGTRLWPMSRADMPKQFLKLFGDLSLYQLTLKRLLASGVTDVIVAANQSHEAILVEQAREIGVVPPRLLLEPARRDSGPAIAAGVAYARSQFGDECVVCAMPCDHLIPETEKFALTLDAAADLARLGYLGTFGIMPVLPSSEFGYLQRGESVAGHAGAFRVQKFHEKPKPDVALRYLSEGGYAWNSGMFVFTAGVFAAEAQLHMPDVWRAASDAVAGAQTNGGTVTLDADAFMSAPKISIDYALFERSQRVAMVEANFSWSDVGNWSSAYESLAKDADGNASIGDVQMRDARNTLAISDHTRVVVVGVDNLVVVARPEGVFVAPKSRASEIKDIVNS
ncbi:MAG: mannose-1-phosphate guanylyltransferase [Beijerinckiaceae bacterium]